LKVVDKNVGTKINRKSYPEGIETQSYDFLQHNLDEENYGLFAQ
jgi:hypothetical protein